VTFFNINGWNVPIVNGGMSEASTPYGNSGKSFTNKQLIRRRMVPRSWTGSMLFQSPSVADTVEGLLMGRGHHFSFDKGFWSDSGVAPATLSDLNVFQGGGEQRFGTGYARFDGTALVSVSFNVDFPTNKWTVIVWGDDAGGGDWHQYAEKANGDTYIDGELQDPALTSFVSVSDGVLTINQANFPTGAAVLGKKLDDLVLLPFNVDDSFIADLYAWQNGNDIAMQCPFNYPGDFVDRVGGREPSAAIPASVASGDGIRKSGEGSLLFTAAADELVYTATGPLQLDNAESQTICFWVRPTSTSVGVGTFWVAYQGTGAASSWLMRFEAGIMKALRRLGTDITLVDNQAATADEWVHYSMVYTTDGASTSSLSLYRNGGLVSSGTTAYAAGTSGIQVKIGNAGNSVTGSIDDFRYYKSALTATQIADIYNQGSYGYDYIPPQDRAFSKLPRLLVSGDCIGSQHPKEVIGSVSSEAYVQHGGPFSPNDRSIEISLEEVSPLREEGIPSPDGNFILSPEFIIDNNAAQIQRESCSGGYQYQDMASAPTLDYDSDDSFGFCLDFDGVGDGIELPVDTSGGSNISSDLGGRHAVTVGAWINPAAIGSSMSVLSIPNTTMGGFSKVFFDVTGGGHLRFGGRDVSGATLLDLTTAASTLSASNWYFILGVMDLRAEFITIYGNLGATPTPYIMQLGTKTTSTIPPLPSPSQNYFSSENGGGARFSRIGINGAGNQPFEGKIKSVMIWKRALDKDEIVTTFRKGYERRIFR